MQSTEETCSLFFSKGSVVQYLKYIYTCIDGVFQLSDWVGSLSLAHFM